jgi:hypothetical protein
MPVSRAIAGLIGLALVGAAGAGSGCVSSKPAAAHATPSSIAPAKIAPVAGDFTDTDANRYRDTTRVIVYIYADSDKYPIPMKPEGSFQFRLENPQGKTIATWNFDRAKTAKAARQLAPGPGFVFDLSLLDLGTDKIEDSEAELLITFTPADGPVLRARPSAPLLVGPLSRHPDSRRP